MSLPDMAGEAGARPLLPLGTQGQGYTFTPTSIPPRDAPQQRNYVFVDEHNRHKRLKVMRACEGCRRRKIKCDAATTNSWPCAACTRLKLNCIPPTVSYEKDSSIPGVQTFELQTVNDYPTVPVGNISDYQQQISISQPQYASSHLLSMHTPVQGHYPQTLPIYHNSTYLTPTSGQDLQYASMPLTSSPDQDVKYHEVYSSAPTVSRSAAALDVGWKPEGSVAGSVVSTADALSDHMGELKIDHLAIAPYIADRNRLAEAPAVEEFEIQLPPQSSSDPRIRIPNEMMPNDHQAQQYFEYYFLHIHPYVPVLNRVSFYNQWNTNRGSISPLLLEAIFACSAMVLEDTQEGNKWLALASKHEESFRDVPRLSTIQATMILLKARESAPKRGYFYRSWMTVVNVVAMAKDLDIHEHTELHQIGQPCNSSVYECSTKTRIWQVLYILEAMIGGPQGRSDFGVTEDSVDLTPTSPNPSLEDSENIVSRQLIYFARVVRNIRGTITLHARLRKTRKDWALDPDFTAHDDNYPKLLAEIPRDLQVTFPQDGSMPWVSSSFIGNMHCYHYLSIIMQHRPKIHFLAETDGFWKQHMVLCHDAAKKMCRIQESMLQSQGMIGLLCMQRGISFTIYCVLTCTMLHLASITSPDPELNTDARDFFARHMRILEQCTPHWPMPEVHAQINALREAFSEDISQPFQLKSGFPFGSPGTQRLASPLTDGAYQPRSVPQNVAMDSVGQINYNTTQPITPPVSIADEILKADSPVVQSLAMTAPQVHTPQPMLQHQNSYPEQQWNPTKIFDQWNVAFGTPPSSTASQPSPPLQQPSTSNYEVRSNPDITQHTYPPHAAYSPHANNMQVPAAVQTQASYTSCPLPPGYVTPTMWQDVVASSFSDGMKRRWDYSGQQNLDMGAKRQQR
ncbi:hypothetical protein EJ08DRAFT_692270 [Tothia fuscella]|uniref:Zn(2)-C6 fungal-type domain-containing protein n=1 Tax=Tothia fuscella TaxID=1048955 RepID=A0A9P4P2P3_9PEZI|nr:hypothetical protein EJ08DRAFT_692270 [Tothia fuscella]